MFEEMRVYLEKKLSDKKHEIDKILAGTKDIGEPWAKANKEYFDIKADLQVIEKAVLIESKWAVSEATCIVNNRVL